jgi:hypothetical protein
MKAILQKGRAGLGNRFQVLGRCLDLAEARGVPLYVDWTDHGWADGFYPYFEIEGHPRELADFSGWSVNPESLKETVGKRMGIDLPWKGVERTPMDGEGDGDLRVIWDYGSPYSNLIFDRLKLTEQVIQSIRETLDRFSLVPGEYTVLHVRSVGSAKLAEPPEETLRRHRPCVLVTDDSEVKRLGIELGYTCPSNIPPLPGGKRSDIGPGIHHDPGNSGMIRRELNLGILTDLAICSLAGELIGNCYPRESTFKILSDRIRETGWIERQVCRDSSAGRAADS